MTLRAARLEDCELVWSINNDPEARSQSVRRQPIPLERHREWFRERLSDPRTLMWIGLDQGRAVGVLRFDLDPERREAVVSIALAAEGRGRGLGRQFIAAGTEQVLARGDVERVIALTRPENVASRRAFEAAGYSVVGETNREEVSLLCLEHGATARSADSGDGGVLFRCDGGPSIGWGHVIRCLALASGLRERGVGSTFLIRDPPPELAERVHAGRHDLVRLEPGVQEAESTIELVRRRGLGGLVLDSYQLGSEFLDAVRAAKPIVAVVIDDLADREMRCDVLLNASPGAKGLGYSRWECSTRLLGPEYALLRQDFWPGRRPPSDRDPIDPLVLVTLGGSRLIGPALEIARSIDALDRPLRIALLLGSRGSGDPDPREFVESAQHPVEVHLALTSTAALLARTTLAISAAGTTCFELAASGVPALLLIAAENQRLGAHAWSDCGVFEVLGDLGSVATLEIARRARDALADAAGLTRRSARGTSLIDGNGAQRAASAVLEVMAARA